MKTPDTELIKSRLRETVRMLFRAENGPSSQNDDDHLAAPDNTTEGIRRVVDGILASDYLPIVRGRGQVDIDRQDTLNKVSSGSPSFLRHVARAEIEVDLFLDHQVAIVRSLLPTTDSRTTPIVEASYRNLHVFVRAEGQWRCVAWQVTRVQ